MKSIEAQNQNDTGDGPDERREVIGRRRPTWLVDAPFWTFSAAIHLILLSLLTLISYSGPDAEEKTIAVKIRMQKSLAPTYSPKEEREIVEIAKIARITRPVPLPKIDMSEWEENDRSTEEISKSLNLDSAALGVAGSITANATLYRDRRSKGSLVREGGNQATESAVLASLKWLQRHQHPDGGWRAQDFVEQCQQHCTNKDPRYGDGLGQRKYDVGVTALAMLAMAGYGHTHRSGAVPEFVECLRKAAAYLMRIQVKSDDPDVNGRYGSTIGHWPYNHSIATLAMAELLAMSGDVVRLKRSVKNAVLLLFHIRNEDSAWRYGIRDGENDTSMTGWMVLALKAARNAGLGIPESSFDNAFYGVVRFIDDVTDDRGKTGYTRRGDFRTPVPCMTAVALLSRLLAGEPRTTTSCRNAVDVCMQHLPVWDEGRIEEVNLYYWYYGSYALFQYGGEPWRRWNQSMQTALLSSQRRGRDEDGSWDPISKWGQRGGRVYSTAIGAMTLEVYYRFARSGNSRTTSVPATGPARKR